MRARARVCVCVCTYYGYPSEIHVDEVIYETIDPDRNSSEGLCANSFVIPSNYYNTTGRVVMVSSNAASYRVRL